MHLRTVSIAGIGAAALVLASLASGAATASPGRAGVGVAMHAAGLGSSHAGTAASSSIDKKKGKCKTKIAPPATLPNGPDGLIAWNNNGGGFDTAGAVDFKCKKKTVINKVMVYGFSGGQSTGLYNVSFYKDSGADKLHEPLDSTAFCTYTGIAGAIGGGYPTSVLTTLNLAGSSQGACTIPSKGTYWVSVQDNDASGPWYWEVSNTQQGYPGDWIDRAGAFTSTCHTFDGNPAGSTTDGGDTYLSSNTNCLTGYDQYLDYRFQLG